MFCLFRQEKSGTRMEKTFIELEIPYSTFEQLGSTCSVLNFCLLKISLLRTCVFDIYIFIITCFVSVLEYLMNDEQTALEYIFYVVD